MSNNQSSLTSSEKKFQLSKLLNRARTLAPKAKQGGAQFVYHSAWIGLLGLSFIDPNLLSNPLAVVVFGGLGVEVMGDIISKIIDEPDDDKFVAQLEEVIAKTNVEQALSRDDLRAELMAVTGGIGTAIEIAVQTGNVRVARILVRETDRVVEEVRQSRVDVLDKLDDLSKKIDSWSGPLQAVDIAAPTSSRRIKIFISSPGDVPQERKIAQEVIDGLRYDPMLQDKVYFDVIAWDKSGASTPMLATMTPQEAINQGLAKPSDCDIVVVIFWSRMGTPLPHPEYQKSDGTQYLSGTEWEFLDGYDAGKADDLPLLVVYRRMEAPTISMNDVDFMAKYEQYQRVNNFFDSFTNADGSIKQGYNQYQKPEDFRREFETHLRKLVARLLETQSKQHKQGKSNFSTEPIVSSIKKYKQPTRKIVEQLFKNTITYLNDVLQQSDKKQSLYNIYHIGVMIFFTLVEHDERLQDKLDLIQNVLFNLCEAETTATDIIRLTLDPSHALENRVINHIRKNLPQTESGSSEKIYTVFIHALQKGLWMEAHKKESLVVTKFFPLLRANQHNARIDAGKRHIYITSNFQSKVEYHFLQLTFDSLKNSHYANPVLSTGQEFQYHRWRWSLARALSDCDGIILFVTPEGLASESLMVEATLGRWMDSIELNFTFLIVPLGVNPKNIARKWSQLELSPNDFIDAANLLEYVDVVHQGLTVEGTPFERYINALRQLLLKLPLQNLKFLAHALVAHLDLKDLVASEIAYLVAQYLTCMGTDALDFLEDSRMYTLPPTIHNQIVRLLMVYWVDLRAAARMAGIARNDKLRAFYLNTEHDDLIAKLYTQCTCHDVRNTDSVLGYWRPYHWPVVTLSCIVGEDTLGDIGTELYRLLIKTVGDHFNRNIRTEEQLLAFLAKIADKGERIVVIFPDTNVSDEALLKELHNYFPALIFMIFSGGQTMSGSNIEMLQPKLEQDYTPPQHLFDIHLQH